MFSESRKRFSRQQKEELLLRNLLLLEIANARAIGEFVSWETDFVFFVIKRNSRLRSFPRFGHLVRVSQEVRSNRFSRGLDAPGSAKRKKKFSPCCRKTKHERTEETFVDRKMSNLMSFVRAMRCCILVEGDEQRRGAAFESTNR